MKLAIDTHEITLVALYALLYKTMLGNYSSLLTDEIEKAVKSAAKDTKEDVKLCEVIAMNL